MNGIVTTLLFAIAAFAPAGTVLADEKGEAAIAVIADDTPVFVKIEGLPTYVAQSVEKEASKGLRHLRQYVQRTKFMHQLDLVSLLMTREQARVARAQNPSIQLAAIAPE
jgi:hypothetical protein